MSEKKETDTRSPAELQKFTNQMMALNSRLASFPVFMGGSIDLQHRGFMDKKWNNRDGDLFHFDENCKECSYEEDQKNPDKFGLLARKVCSELGGILTHETPDYEDAWSRDSPIKRLYRCSTPLVPMRINIMCAKTTPEGWIKHATLPAAGLYRPGADGKPIFFQPTTMDITLKKKMKQMEETILTGKIPFGSKYDQLQWMKYSKRGFSWTTAHALS